MNVQSPAMMSCSVKVLDNRYTVYGYPDEGWFKLLSKHGSFEKLPQGYNVRGLCELVPRRDAVCLDVGANLGLVTLALAQTAPDGPLYAFEPDKLTYAACARTLSVSSYDTTLLPWVVGRQNARGRFVVRVS